MPVLYTRSVSTVSGGSEMEIRLFGPMVVRANDTPVDTGPPRQRAVLAALAVDVGRTVLIDNLGIGSGARNHRVGYAMRCTSTWADSARR
jgi:hypothetical protein